MGIFDGTRPRSPLTRVESAATFMRMARMFGLRPVEGAEQTDE